MDNRTIARRLLDYARNLDGGEGNLFRVKAYRRAAETLERLERPVEQILDEKGRPGLRKLPGIGRHLAFTIDELVRTGKFRTMG
jgi:DNA polymerase/3'-5' exonuclease PolX